MITDAFATAVQGRCLIMAHNAQPYIYLCTHRIEAVTERLPTTLKGNRFFIRFTASFSSTRKPNIALRPVIELYRQSAHLTTVLLRLHRNYVTLSFVVTT